MDCNICEYQNKCIWQEEKRCLWQEEIDQIEADTDRMTNEEFRKWEKVKCALY